MALLAGHPSSSPTTAQTPAMQGDHAPLPLPASADGQAAESPDMVGLKDGLAVAPDSSSLAEMVSLSIKCPSLSDVSAESTLLSVPCTASIAQIKRQIESSWLGRPQALGMRFFKAGQLLTDDMIVGEIVPPRERSEPAAMHLVIRPSAWSEPRPGLSRRTTSTSRPARRAPSPHAAWVHAGTSETTPVVPTPLAKQALGLPVMPSMHLPQRSPRHTRLTPQDRHLTSVIEKMEPGNYSSFRSLLTWSYYRYVDMYEEAWKQVYGGWAKEPEDAAIDSGKSVERMAAEMDCSPDEVLAAVLMVEAEGLEWRPIEEELAQSKLSELGVTYRTVSLRGLPYLLQLKQDPRSGPLGVLLGRIKRLQDVIHRMDKLISYQNLFEQATNTSALQASMRRSQAAVLAAAAAANGAAAPGNGRTGTGGNHRVRVVVNMTEFFNIAVPAFFLSLKMTLLVYVFTRGASTLKTCLIAGAGVLFVLLEAWKTAQRHNEVRQRVAVREAERQRGPRPPSGAATPPAGVQETETENDSLESLRPHAPIRRRTQTALSIDYWIELFAYVGLDDDEREFGWRPHSAQRPVPPTNALVRAVWERVLLPALLLLATLVPEIEQKRRRAVDQRDDLIRTTAKVVEERKARGAEKARTSDDNGEGPSSVAPASSTADEEVPSYLQHPYCQRIIHQRRTGRQIDIAEEVEAAAAAAEGQGADMGFL